MNRHLVTKRAPLSARTSRDGLVFHSKAEKDRWEELRKYEEAGLIRNLRRQVSYDLYSVDLATGKAVPIKTRSIGYPNGRACRYTLDFLYEQKHGGKWTIIYEEYKGVDDPVSRLRRSILEAMLQVVITITGPARNPSRKRTKRAHDSTFS